MAKSNAERETIIRRAADEQDWELFTEDPRVIRIMSRIWGAGKPKGEGAVWRVPKAGLSFRKPRALDAAARKTLADRLRVAQKASK
jgi:hypothetical protein